MRFSFQSALSAQSALRGPLPLRQALSARPESRCDRRGPWSRAQLLARTPLLKVREIQRYVLDNGLQVLLVPDPSAPLVSFQCWYHVGSKHEQPGRTGMAHLFEHLMFKETRNIPEGAFSRILEEAGARDLNAWTWHDETVYTESVPRQHLELVLRLEADRMVNLVLNQGQLDAEREVVINERRFRSEDDPFGRLNEQLFDLAFERHPYRWPVIGYRADLEAITLEDCLDFYRRFYAPNNATLILAGDLQPDRALELIERHYGPLPACPVDRQPAPLEPEQTALRRMSMALQVETEVLQLGLKTPELSHPDRPALQVLDTVLFHGRTSRLERRLIDGGVASSVSSMLAPWVDPGLYEIEVNLREGKTSAEAEAIMLEELARVSAEGITAQELERARRKIQLNAWQELRENGSRANFLGLYELGAGSYERGLEAIQAMEQVTLEDVQRVALRWLKEEGMTAAHGKPAGRGLEGLVPGQALPESAEELEDEEELDEEVGDEAEAADDAMPSVSLAFLETDAQDDALSALAAPWKVEELSLGGSSLLLVEEHTLPLFHFQMIIPGGIAGEPEEAEGLAQLASDLLLRGTKRLNRQAFEDALEDLGATLDISVELDYISITGSGLTSSWEAVTGLLKEALLEPRLDPAELDQLKEETLAEIQEARNDDKTLADQWFSRLLFPGHPYGRLVLGTEESVARVTLEEVKAWYARALHGEGLLIGVAGDVEAQQAKETFAGLIRGLPSRGAMGPGLPPFPRTPGRRLFLIDKPDRKQTQVLLGHDAPAAEHPDYPLLSLGLTAFGGSAFTTRLMTEVREKRGWSYGAYARLARHRDGAQFSIWVFPAMKDALPCLELVLELYDQLVAEGITQDELEYARKTLLNGAAFDEDTPEHCLHSVMEQRWSRVQRRQRLEVVARASLDEVNAALRRHCRPEELTIAMVCTAAGLEGAAAGLEGIDQVQVLAYDSL